MKILIIDDDKTYTDTLKDVLVEKGHEVLTLNFSHLANKYINDFQPEVVLTDLKMQTSGFDIAWGVSQNHPEIKVFGITNYFDIDKTHWLVKLCNFKDVFEKTNTELLVNHLQELR